MICKSLLISGVISGCFILNHLSSDVSVVFFFGGITGSWILIGFFCRAVSKLAFILGKLCMDFSIDLKSLTVGRDRDSFFKSANKSSSEAVSSGTCALSENDSVSEVSIIVGISVIVVMRKRIFFFCIFFFYTFINEKSFYLNAIGESTDN